jgi:tRNA (cytidine/uridine-2'-O-)-methyltransferase
MPPTRIQLPFTRPDPPLQIVLVEPRIPQNTGNIARLCAATGSVLHLVGPMGFTITDAKLKRAGLDYWHSVEQRHHDSLQAFLNHLPPDVRLHLLSTRASTRYTERNFRPGDYLVLGSETDGLPPSLLDAYPDDLCGIPILLDHVRSLNLATSTGIVVYEALRQIGTCGYTSE